MTGNEIRERTHIAALELSKAALAINYAQINLLMRHFDQVREDLFNLRDAVLDAIKLIPKEDKD